ncbi:MAG TPA: hypothetical protein PK876_04600 [Elusimicrobiota bacterium]|nr:hypothetical protein [Elusimicrobiota bacterium]
MKKKTTKKKVTKKKTVRKAVRTTKRIAKKAAGSKVKAKAGRAKTKKSKNQNPILPWRVADPGEAWIGTVEDYYGHIGVITTVLKAPIRVGDRLRVRGHTTDVTMTVSSMQIEHVAVRSAETASAVGIKVTDKMRRGDYIYKLK